jgi:hypothetical protein
MLCFVFDDFESFMTFFRKFFQLLVCGISDCCGIRYYREYLGSTRAHYAESSCPGRDERDLRTTFKYTK